MTSTSLIISDITIHQDADGRYSLNDLHKAAGNHDKDKPANFMRSEKTVEIKGVLIAQNRAFKPVEVRKGRHGGTYVCKELVYAYAMWISAEFALKVIRAYDALVSGHIGKKTTVADRTPLRHAVNMLVSKKHLPYPEAWALVHQRFNVEHVDDLPADALKEAIEYVHRLALEGEYISRPASIPEGVRGVVALYMDGPEVVRSEYRTGVVHVGTVDEFESIIRHYGGMVLWDEKQQREFVRERALMRL